MLIVSIQTRAYGNHNIKKEYDNAALCDMLKPVPHDEEIKGALGSSLVNVT